jgi:hypothetical protein
MVIKLLFEGNTLSAVDWAQIASAVGTVVAAVMAMITAFQMRRSNKHIEIERHLMVKPLFRIRSHFEQRLEKKIEFNVVNLGFNRVMNSIDTVWEGNEGVRVTIKEFHKKSPQDDDLQITLDFFECADINIRGSLFVVYTDVLGKLYKERVNVEINSVYVDINEEYIPILEGLVNTYFN